MKTLARYSALITSQVARPPSLAFGEAFASTGAERTLVRRARGVAHAHRSGEKTKPKAKIGGRPHQMRRFIRARYGAILSLSLLTACGASFDPGYRVTSFRVLAVQADTPFAKPGDTVHLTSLSYDPQGRTVNWAWATCLNPSASTVEGCLAKINADSGATGVSPIAAEGPGLDRFSYTVPSDALDALPAAARPSALVGVLSVACPGDLSVETGAADLPFRCTDPSSGRVLGGDEYVVGLKRISVRAVDRNQNPSIAKITFDGADWPEGEVKAVTACDTDGNEYAKCADSTKHQIAAVVTPDSVESGTTEFGESFSEQVVVEYYATEGLFENAVRLAESPETGWAARSAARGEELRIWFVVHDDRGGVTWLERSVRVE